MAEDSVRIIKDIEIEGRKARALFDTGSFHTYVSRSILEPARFEPVSKPYSVLLGGRKIEIKENCIVHGTIDGLEFDTLATPIDKVGRVDGKELDVIIGALTMEQWEIIPNPKAGTLDVSGLKRREFTEFGGGD